MIKKPKVVFNAGIYDLLHEGHMKLLRAMRKEADYLIVIVHDDRSCFEIKDKVPVQMLEHRVQNLRITGIPDEIMVTRSTDPAPEFLRVILKSEKHTVTYMRGDDLKKDFPGRWMLERFNVPIKFLPYTKGVSSTQLKKQLWS